MEPQCQLERWDGKATARLAATSADEAWSLLSDFCRIHLWLPGLDTCRLIAGAEGQPGCVRYCATGPPSGDGDGDGDGKPVQWAYEELLDYDADGRSYTYRVGENNLGLEGYVGTLKVLPPPEEGSGCALEWRFESEPSQGWTREGLLGYLQSGLEVIAKRVEEATAAAVSISCSSGCGCGGGGSSGSNSSSSDGEAIGARM